MRRLLFLVWKELLELRQDKRMLPIVFVAPVIQLIVLGYAATTDVRHVPMVIVDEDRTPASRTLIDRFNASPYFTVTAARQQPAAHRGIPRARRCLAGPVHPRWATGRKWAPAIRRASR